MISLIKKVARRPQIWMMTVTILGCHPFAKSAYAADQSSSHDVKVGDIAGRVTVTPVTSANVGESLVDVEIANVKSTFASRMAPYPGYISNTIDCGPKKYVKEKTSSINGATAKVVLAVANGRRLFGSCLAEDIKFSAGVLAFFEASKQRVVVIKLFKPVTAANQISDAQQKILQAFPTLMHDL